MKIYMWDSMLLVWFCFNLCLVITLSRAKSAASEMKTLEICNLDSTNISCAQNELVLIQKAEYGRMRIGKCVKTSMGYIGCRMSVLAALDKLCSGKQGCNFFLPMQDTDIYKESKLVGRHSKCLEEVTPYLELSYTCVKVLPNLGSPCRPHHPILLPPQTGFLSPLPHTDQGSPTCPFWLTAQDGQHFDIKLFTFISKVNPCTTIAKIHDRKKNIKHEVSTCDLHSVSSREEKVNVPKSSDLEITFTREARQLQKVLLQYQVTGCANIPTSPGQTFKRGDQTAELICRKGNALETSFLECKGTEWIGNRNCSSADAAPMSTGSDAETEDSSFPVGLVLVVAIGVGLGIFLGGIMLICVNIYMKRKHKHEYAQPDYDIHDMDYSMQLSQHHGKSPDIGGMHHPFQNHPMGTATLVAHRHNGEETLININGPRCAKHYLPQGPVMEEVTSGNIDDLTKSSFMPPYKGDKQVTPITAAQTSKKDQREKDLIF